MSPDHKTRRRCRNVHTPTRAPNFKHLYCSALFICNPRSPTLYRYFSSALSLFRSVVCVLFHCSLCVRFFLSDALCVQVRTEKRCTLDCLPHYITHRHHLPSLQSPLPFVPQSLKYSAPCCFRACSPLHIDFYALPFLFLLPAFFRVCVCYHFAPPANTATVALSSLPALLSNLHSPSINTVNYVRQAPFYNTITSEILCAHTVCSTCHHGAKCSAKQRPASTACAQVSG